MPRHSMIILGAGLAGLSFAHELLKLTDVDIVIVEKAPSVGGLARTLTYDGYRFDLGGHRFFSESDQIMDWLRDLMGADLIEVDRISRIRLGKRYVDYPLVLPQAMAAFGPITAMSIGFSYCWSVIRRRFRSGGEHTFEEWVRSRFGAKLFEIYFRPYTEKVWGITCDRISEDWARDRISLTSLGAAIRKALFKRGPTPRTIVSSFLYPRRGIGDICNRLVQSLERTGRCRIELGTTPRRLERLADDTLRLTASASHTPDMLSIDTRRLVSTIPVHALTGLINPADDQQPMDADPLKLAYRDLICIFVEVERERVSSDTWTYFPESRFIFGRIHEPRNWSAEMAPDGRTSLCLELFCTEGDSVWSLSDDELIRRTIDGAVDSGFVERSWIGRTWIERVTHAYPLFEIGYEQHMAALNREIAEAWPQILLHGRTGSFRYMNMDHVVHASIEAAKREAGRMTG